MATTFRRLTTANEKEYIASGGWKCAGSPTGAHWWNCNAKPPICKICGKINIVDAPVPSTLPA